MTLKNPGLLPTVTQLIYRLDVPSLMYFTQPPNVILSLLGYKQLAPATVDTFVGFDVRVSATRTTAFDLVHNVYGASMAYLNYMYLAVAQTNTDFILGEYSQTFDMMAVNKNYSIDVGYKAG